MTPWKIDGELILSCNCNVFCPCVVSLGKHPPTEGFCQGWWGMTIESGHYGDVPLDGLNAGMLLDIPHSMSRGNWTTAAYVDERATPEQVEAITKIYTGQAGGSTFPLSVLVGTFLGTKQAPITYARDGKGWRFVIPGIIDGHIEPIPGGDKDGEVKITNSAYWIAPDIIVSKAKKSRLKDFGRIWDFADRSAEACRIAWSGP